MTLFALLIAFDILALGALGVFMYKRNVVRSREFVCMASGALVMTAGRMLDQTAGWFALAMICAGLLMVLVGAYFADEAHDAPVWLDRFIRLLFRIAPGR